MRTLFSENIFSPSPTAEASKQDPLQLSFPSSLSNSTTTSTSSSPVRSSWLTQRMQTRSRDEAESSSRAYPTASASQSPRSHARRKGNPKLLFMGTRRSGKSSIQKVVFQKMPPTETLFLEPTNEVQSILMQTFLPVTSTEIPSHQLPHDSLSNIDHSQIFSNVGAAIWVLDIQDEYQDSVAALLSTAVWLAEHHPRINLEVLIHKTDGLSDEYRYQTYREVSQRVQDELSDMGFGYPSVNYHQTSIFDSSIFEAMSKIIQKLLPQLAAMESLLNKLCSTCRIQKAYLFDTVSKVYVATDASPTFQRDYEVCSDYVDVIIDIKQIYGWQQHARSPSAIAKANEENINESMVTYDRSGDTYIYAREINEYLTLICVMGKGSSADKRVLIDYNVGILHDALLQIFKV